MTGPKIIYIRIHIPCNSFNISHKLNLMLIKLTHHLSMAGSPWVSAHPTPPPPVMLLFEVSLCVCCGYSFGLDFWVSNERWLDGCLHFTDLGWCQNGFWYESMFYCVNTCHFVCELLSEWNLLLPCFYIVAVVVAFESSVIVAEDVFWNAS